MQPMFEEITSLQNRYVKLVAHLKKKRERKKEELFLIEGFKEITLAYETGYEIETLFYCPSFFSQEEELLVSSLKTKSIRCSENVFQKMSLRDSPDGLLAIAKVKDLGLDDLPISDRSFYLIAENIEKPGNLGAILRSADAAGAQGVIVVDERVDVYHPQVIRSSVGALFSLPVVTSTNDEVAKWLKKHKIILIAASPEAETSYSALSLKGSCAFIVGAEHEGLSQFWKERADELVKIPMMGKMDSLNVSVTAALLLFEARRWSR